MTAITVNLTIVQEPCERFPTYKVMIVEPANETGIPGAFLGRGITKAKAMADLIYRVESATKFKLTIENAVKFEG